MICIHCTGHLGAIANYIYTNSTYSAVFIRRPAVTSISIVNSSSCTCVRKCYYRFFIYLIHLIHFCYGLVLWSSPLVWCVHVKWLKKAGMRLRLWQLKSGLCACKGFTVVQWFALLPQGGLGLTPGSDAHFSVWRLPRVWVLWLPPTAQTSCN